MVWFGQHHIQRLTLSQTGCCKSNPLPFRQFSITNHWKYVNYKVFTPTQDWGPKHLLYLNSHLQWFQMRYALSLIYNVDRQSYNQMDANKLYILKHNDNSAIVLPTAGNLTIHSDTDVNSLEGQLQIVRVVSKYSIYLKHKSCGRRVFLLSTFEQDVVIDELTIYFSWSEWYSRPQFPVSDKPSVLLL